MARIKPYRGVSKARLESLIRKSKTPVIPQQVSIAISDTPEAFSNPFRNTKVAVTGTTASGSSSSVEMAYKRLELGRLNDLPRGELIPYANIVFPTTVHQILDTINEALGINLLPHEVLNDTIEKVPVNGLTLNVTAASHAWLSTSPLFGYAPGADAQAGRAEDNRIPTDERRRIRVLEQRVVL